MTKIEAFFTTSVTNNGYDDQLASRILFAPLHHLLSWTTEIKAGRAFEVNLACDKVTPIDQAEPDCQNLAVRILLLVVSLLLVIPCTLVGALVKAAAELIDEKSAERNAKVVHWLALERMTPPVESQDLRSSNIRTITFSFLTSRELGEVSQVSKFWRQCACSDLLWKPHFDHYTYFFGKREDENYKAAVKARYVDVRVQYGPYMPIFGSISKILAFPRFELPHEHYFWTESIEGMDRNSSVFYGYKWPNLRMDQLPEEPVVFGAGRAGNRFILIRYVRTLDRDVPIPNMGMVGLPGPAPALLQQGDQEGFLVLNQALLTQARPPRVWRSFVALWPSTGTGVTPGFIETAEDVQWITDLLSGRSPGPRPRYPYRGLQEAGATVAYRLWQPLSL